MKKLSLRNLQKMIDEKYIHVQKHPDMDLWIYDYSPHAQFDKVWNNETMSCRGLIMDDKYNILARPFPKFFNLEEYGDQGKSLPLEDFEIFDKLDGSLGILYWNKDKPYLATRGSFASRQAIKGTSMLHNKIKENKGALVFDPKYTYLFEIIYPLNRIVVDYGDLEDLFLLAVINTQTGTEKSYSDIIARYGDKLSIAKRYDGITDYKEFSKQQRDNSEGYVIRFKQDNLRIKVKFTEYKRLHKLMTGVNARRIWELLQVGASIEDMCQQVPDEFYNWVQKAAQRIKTKYRGIEITVLNAVAETEDQGFTGDAKELKKQKVQYVMSRFPKIYWSLILMIIDGRDYRGQIWKMIKPAHEEPFNQQLDTG